MSKKLKLSFIQILILLGLSMTILMIKDKFYFILLGLFLAVYLLRSFALNNPQSYWTRLLYRDRGPRTDMKDMSKEELYKSGFKYLIWAICLSPLVVIIGYQVGKRPQQEALFLGLLFATFLLFLTSLAAGLYLLFRGLIRKKI